eukprot:c11439_g1_i1.p1 GENE.c11439_g1_i1~~c11439_g1_i1.p1  ORF type:complete len:196 (+),score=36.84 c11439_g1_i1:35-622(+)
MREGYDYLFLVVVVGDSSVGKTSLMNRYCDGRFDESAPATVGVDYKVRRLELAEGAVQLQIWDTAGQERFRSVAHSYYRSAHGVVFVYDATNRESFNHISQWLDSVKQHGKSSVSRLLVANKTDLGETAVREEEGKSFAASHGIPFISVSAKTGRNVSECFETLATIIRKRLIDADTSQPAEPLRVSAATKRSCC